MTPRTHTLALAGALATLSAAVTATPAAQAADAGSVVFGDSIPSNPEPGRYLAGKLPAGSSAIDGYAERNALGCATDRAFSSTIGQITGLTTADYTCAGASFHTGGIHIIDAIDKAAADGELTAATREAYIMAGANDTYPYLSSSTPDRVRRAIASSTANAVNAIRRHAAPNAKVKVVGYPTTSTPDGMICPVNVIPGQPTPAPIDIRPWENALQWAQVDGADQSGAQFVDVKPASATKGMCSPDRWIIGVIDTTAPAPAHMPVHLTDIGVREVAGVAARA